MIEFIVRNEYNDTIWHKDVPGISRITKALVFVVTQERQYTRWKAQGSE